MANPAAGVNSLVTTNAAEGFDYFDKSVIFHLSINANGINFSSAENAAGANLGKVTVTDTLPNGWEFAEIIPGADYLIFEGSANGNSGSVRATDTTPDTVPELTADFSGRTATFTFDPLAKPYVILIKAKPNADTLAKYFNDNKTTTETNSLSLQAENWTPGVSVFRDVSIKSEILQKGYEIPQAGELRWTVDYKPYDLPLPGNKLEDTLPLGIDLRTNSSGVLLLGGNITAHQLILDAKGDYTLGVEVTLKIGENISYDNKNRVLTFHIPDSKQAYRFSYLTDITGDPGTVSNKVLLFGEGSQQVEANKPYVISAADGEASLKKNGSINITKIDGTGKGLADAEFTIFALDGQTVIKRGVTGSEGTLKLKVIPDGDYVLKETVAPTGYTLESASHTLSVKTESGKVTTSIDSKTGSDSNMLQVKNFKSGTVGSLMIRRTLVPIPTIIQRVFRSAPSKVGIRFT
ncbi:prealbumin-like fold domain-containing protein [Desulforamulus aeronauticus]